MKIANNAMHLYFSFVASKYTCFLSFYVVYIFIVIQMYHTYLFVVYYFISQETGGLEVFRKNDLNIGSKDDESECDRTVKGQLRPQQGFSIDNERLVFSIRTYSPKTAALPRCCGAGTRRDFNGGREQTRPCSVLAVDFKIATRRPS